MHEHFVITTEAEELFPQWSDNHSRMSFAPGTHPLCFSTVMVVAFRNHAPKKASAALGPYSATDNSSDLLF